MSRKCYSDNAARQISLQAWLGARVFRSNKLNTSSPRRPANTIRILSSEEYLGRVCRRIPFTTRSASSLARSFFRLIIRSIWALMSLNHSLKKPNRSAHEALMRYSKEISISALQCIDTLCTVRTVALDTDLLFSSMTSI